MAHLCVKEDDHIHIGIRPKLMHILWSIVDDDDVDEHEVGWCMVPRTDGFGHARACLAHIQTLVKKTPHFVVVINFVGQIQGA